jgi:uncharacterized membrane protein YgdD (TMEM256/DUF423 family)
MRSTERGKPGSDERNFTAKTCGMNSRTAVSVSAIMGFLAVALGAFGAHGLEPTLRANGLMDRWNTAAHYHLIHAVAMVAVALHAPLRKWTWRCWLLGTLIFSGSLYFLAALNMKILGPVTPFGGLFLLGGWLMLIFEKPSPPTSGNASISG